MQFLKYTLATLVGLLIFSFIALVIFLGAIGSLSVEEPVVVKENSILQLSLNRPISELEKENPFAEFAPLSPPTSTGLVQLVSAIEHAAADEKIRGIYLDAPIVMAGFATTGEIRRALDEFKESGKFVIAYANNLTEGGYYLSTVADEVYVHPEGIFELNGINSSVMFLKGTLDKLDIEAQIFRVGEFKSAVEVFQRSDMSDENRLQLQELLTSITSRMIVEISAERDLSIGELTDIVAGMKARTPAQAVELDLIDGTLYADELMEIFREKLQLEDDDPEFISYDRYKKSYSDYSGSKEKIAVVVASGDIVDGGDETTIDGRKFARLIRKAREDEQVKAIVLRINSPGGQLQASDLIWREVKLAAEEKTMIASFSDYATSGGYYIGMAADTILAAPTTVTGSIGIFGILFNFGEMLENKLGITFDEVNTGEFASLYPTTRSLTEGEKEIVQAEVERGYDSFITKVSEGRDMDVSQVIELAGGRVWSGEQALDNGLIDLYGGLGDAIDLAAESAGLEEYRIYYYPKQRTILEEIMEIGSNPTEGVVQREIGEIHSLLGRVRQLIKYQGLQARTPWEIQLSY